MRHIIATISIALLFAPAPSWSAKATTTETGKIYLRESSRKKPAYLYKKTTSETESRRNVRTEYLSLTGELLVEETYQYEKDKLIRYVYNQLQMKEGGYIDIHNGKIKYEFTKEGVTNSDEGSEPETIMIGDLISSFIKKNWDALYKEEETIHTRYLVLERQDTFGFKFFTDGERACGEKKCAQIIMKPSSIFVAALVDSIKILVDKAEPHAIREIDGRLPIRIPEVPDPKTRKDYRALEAILVLD